MKKLSLSPEELRVESFPTEAAPSGSRGTVAAHWIVTRPECANTVYDTCDTCNTCDASCGC
jgi:hypothetical protein